MQHTVSSQPPAHTMDATPQSVAVPARSLEPLPPDGSGWKMLFYKEVLRFWRVAFQTVAAPVLTAVLYLLIFGNVLSRQAMPGSLISPCSGLSLTHSRVP